METATADVEVQSQTSASTEAADSSPVVETSGESQGSVTAPEAAQTQQVETPPADVLEGLPTLEELKAQAEQKVPMAQGLYNVRSELERVRPLLREYEALDSWKPVAESVGDPQLAQQAYELISSIHTPSETNPSGFISTPFLQRIEQESPGTIDQIFADICSFPIDIDGQRTTVVRELYKSHGLNPDRIDDYRNIDNLRASGVVTEADLAKVPNQFHDAFKGLSKAAQEDLLSIIESNPLVAEEQLRNAQDALEARGWRQRDEQAKAEQVRAEQARFERQVEQAVETDILGKVKSWSDTIRQNLSSQWKPSTDEAANQLEYAKILSTLATLQHPGYRFIAEEALKQVGASLDGFDQLINDWQVVRSRYVTMTEMNDVWQARQAEAQASRAEQRILIKLNDYAQRLSTAKGAQAAAQSQQMVNQLETAQGRFVPNGNGNQQLGATNPYSQNPHPIGSQEYYAFNRKIDREYQLTNASAYGG